MEVWRTGVFDDSISDELKFRYRDLIGNGTTGEQATSILLREYVPTLDSEDEIRVFWLSLAATQWKLWRQSDYPHDRLTVIGKISETVNSKKSNRTICWQDFDYYLKEWFHLDK